MQQQNYMCRHHVSTFYELTLCILLDVPIQINANSTLVNVYVDLLVFTRIAGTS